MALNKMIQNEILDDLMGDFQRAMQKTQMIIQENWGDEKNVPYSQVEELLYMIKVVEQRLKYLGEVRY